MINFNGKIFSGRNVNVISGGNVNVFSGGDLTIVNGRVISGGETGETQKFDERKSADASTVESIVIETTSIDVNVSASNSSKIEAHLYGQAYIDGDVKFDFCVVNRELRITLDITGSCYNGNLSLDVTVPTKKIEMITARSVSADFIFEEGILTDFIKVKTESGDLEINATFVNAIIITNSGDIELYTEAKENISVDISATSGDVSAEFNNVGHIDLHASSISGDIKNRHKDTTGYTANVTISTISGDIKVR